MPKFSCTHAAITGSRFRPCSVYGFPPKFEPFSLSQAADWMLRGVESFAASVAVMPGERARNQAIRSEESATILSRQGAAGASIGREVTRPILPNICPID